MKRSLALLLGVVVACGGSSASVDGASSGSSGGGASSGGAVTPGDEHAALQLKLVDDVTVQDIAIFQAVRVNVVKGGERVAADGAPIVAGRRGVIRVYVQPNDGVSRAVTCVLSLKSGGKQLEAKKVTKTISAASDDAKPATVFDFDLKPEEVTADLSYSVSLVADEAAPAASAPATSDARYPRAGDFEALGATESSSVVKVVLVPVQYMADGSGRLPDVSEDQVEVFRQTMLSLYPVAKVDITVREPFVWQNAIGGNGSGWDTILNAITRLRSQDRAPADVYYYGAFAPRTSFGSFCSQGCVTGLSSLVQNPADSMMRASVGVGYTGPRSAETMAHEIGHAHGRPHAPCGGAQGTDPSWPTGAAYKNATLGTWGFNIIDGTFINPGAGASQPHDMMSYCDPTWISDYQYNALFQRVVAVNGTQAFIAPAPGSAPQAQKTRSYRIAAVDGAGNLTFDAGPAIQLDREPVGELRSVRFVGKNAGYLPVAGNAHFFPYDHLPGGTLLVPEPATAFEAVEFQGKTFKR